MTRNICWVKWVWRHHVDILFISTLRFIDGQSEDEGYGSLGRSTGSKINLQVQSREGNSTSGSSESRNLDNHGIENIISFLLRNFLFLK